MGLLKVTALKVFVLLLLLIGAAVVIVRTQRESILARVVDDRVILTPDSAATRDLMKPAVSLQSFFVFSLANHDDVLNGTAPRVIQLGPYVFRTGKNRKDLSWNGDLLRYQEKSTTSFDASKSSGTLSDKVVTVNPIVLELIRLGRVDLIGNRQLFFEATVGDLLRKGFSDPLLKNENVTDIVKVPIRNGLAGLFVAGTKGAADGEYEIYSGLGEGNRRRLNRIVTLNGSRSLRYYGEGCNRLEGANDERYPPAERLNLGSDLVDDDVLLFTPQLCKPWRLQLQPTRNRHSSTVVPLWTASYASDDLFSSTGNATVDACLEGSERAEIKGTFDASLCHDGLPVIFSKPHFYPEGPPNELEGLNPSYELHDSSVHVYPVLGTVIDKRIRVQTNFKLTPGPNEGNMTNFLFPIFWQELRPYEDPERTAWRLFWSVDLLRRSLEDYSVLVAAGCFGLALLLILVGSCCYCVRKRCGKRQDSLLTMGSPRRLGQHRMEDMELRSVTYRTDSNDGVRGEDDT